MVSFSLGYRSDGEHLGSSPVAVWQVVAVHPDSARLTARYLDRVAHCPHFVWDPRSGEVIECVPLDRAARLFSREINRAGAPLIQVAVVGPRDVLFTDTPMRGAEILFKTLESSGVPEVWPMGPPTLQGLSEGRLGVSLAPGHYSIDQLDSSFLGIGPIDVRKMRYERAAAGG